MNESSPFSSKIWEIRESLPSEAVNWSRSEINAAHKFRFGRLDELPFVLTEFGVDLTKRDLLRLPFERVIFEYDSLSDDKNYNRYVYLCHERPAQEAWCDLEPMDFSEKIIEVISLRRDASEWWQPLSPKPIVISSYQIYAVPPVKNYRDYGDNFDAYVSGDTVACMIGCVALSASCFTTTDVIIPTKLQQARLRAGRPALYEYKIVNLSATTEVRRPSIGTHSSPMLHWRRGHYRRLTASGRLVPVAPCLVGDAANGISDKALYDARIMIKDTFK